MNGPPDQPVAIAVRLCEELLADDVDRSEGRQVEHHRLVRLCEPHRAPRSSQLAGFEPGEATGKPKGDLGRLGVNGNHEHSTTPGVSF